MGNQDCPCEIERRMNLALDRLLRQVARDPSLLDGLDADTAGGRIEEGDIAALLARDLPVLFARGAHPLLIMQFAGALHIEPMAAFRREG